MTKKKNTEKQGKTAIIEGVPTGRITFSSNEAAEPIVFIELLEGSLITTPQGWDELQKKIRGGDVLRLEVK